MKTSRQTILVIVMILIAAALRIMNVEMGLWLNFTFIGAMSLFSGAAIRNKPLAMLVPVVFYLMTDIYLQLFTNTLGFYGVSQLFTYLAMVMVVLLGGTMTSGRPLYILGYSIGGSALFWIISNFGVWFGNLFTDLEPGLTLVHTYVRALPFYNDFARELFLGTFVGDLVFNGLLFGAFALITRKSAVAQAA